MQYHRNGFRPGDPAAQLAPLPRPAPGAPVDVAIIGCGPAGLTLAAQLALIGGLSVRIFERKPGPLEVGQADGVACRSMEMFEAFGFAHRVRHEAYWVNETTFWRPTPEGSLSRADRIQDVEDDLSHQPHVILNQARVHDFYLEIMARAGLTPDYGHGLTHLARAEGAEGPISLSFETDGGPRHVSARTVVGCDGARSAVRAALGYRLEGQSARQLWGVMDVLAVTDFPDIRLKCAVQSATSGSLLIIPREGGHMVRLYIELDPLPGDDRAADRTVTADLLEARAQAILAPYSFSVRQVAWCSAYEIGQRVCDRFDDATPELGPRIFIAGDACHTHSPKAGQGMNVSMADTFNLGWKLAHVLQGKARPDLLRSYSQERQAKAQELIDFDRDMARLFSARTDTPEDAARFQRYFQQHGRYTAGVETTYAPSAIVAENGHQALATGQTVGKRFHSAPVIRLADGKPMQLSEACPADGRWRLIAFAPMGERGGPGGAIAALCETLVLGPHGPIARYTPPGTDCDQVLDLRAVFQSPHADLDVASMPPLLRPLIGKYKLTDYEKVFCADPAADIFDLRGIDRDRGALILLRPDQFVAHILPLDQTGALAEFLDGVLLPVCAAP